MQRLRRVQGEFFKQTFFWILTDAADPQMEPCGYCQSCRHNKEYADQVENILLLMAMSSIFLQMLAPATCENIVCEDPIDLFGTNHKVLGEDGTCPTKVIMGKLYDFRCYFCKILPRVGMANR